MNNYTPYWQVFPSVASLPGADNNGDFIISWTSNMQDGSLFGIYGQRYSGASNSKSGSEFRINTATTNIQIYPSVTSLSNGGFVVVWMSNEQDGSGFGIYGQKYSANGSRIGSEFLVNTCITNNQIVNLPFLGQFLSRQILKFPGYYYPSPLSIAI